MMAVRPAYDVVVVGAGIAGCLASILFARRGLKVRLLEKSGTLHKYKILCTHFFQPVALPVLEESGLDAALEAAGAVRTRAAFWTEAGWIDPAGGYVGEGRELHAYNVERRVLDPQLRRLAAQHPNVELTLGADLAALEPAGGGAVVEYVRNGTRQGVRGRLIVAADGRHSKTAKITENVATEDKNDRATYFAYFKGIPAPAHDRSLFMLKQGEMAFLYPLAEERTLLSVYITPERAKAWRRSGEPIARSLLDYVREYPVTCDMSKARIDSRIYGYHSYPNLTRAQVRPNVAFVGDAALSLDAMSGVGCSFAVCSANLLVEETSQALLDGGNLEAALASYARRHDAFFSDHARGIKADSLISKSPQAMLGIYRNIAKDPRLQQAFIALTGRLVTPQGFQRSFVKSLSANARAAVS